MLNDNHKRETRALQISSLYKVNLQKSKKLQCIKAS